MVIEHEDTGMILKVDEYIHPSTRPIRRHDIEIPRVKTFIEKSLSEDTRRAYSRALLDFFVFVNKFPSQITVDDVIAYRDHLVKALKRKPRTVNVKLSVVRAYFSYLKIYGDITFNPADTNLVSIPPVPEDMAGRALSAEDVRHLILAPDRRKVEGARDHALLMTFARTSLRVSEVRNLRLSSIVWNHDRWVARVKVKGGRERVIPFPDDVKKAIDSYLKLDAHRRQVLHCDGDDAFIFQPVVNFRTLEFARPLSARHICEIVNHWAGYIGINRKKQRLSPHDLRRTAVTRALSLGASYRQVQGMTGHKDIRMVVRYDQERGNIEENAINFLHY